MSTKQEKKVMSDEQKESFKLRMKTARENAKLNPKPIVEKQPRKKKEEKKVSMSV